MTPSTLEQIVANQPRLAGLQVLANVDFGHTSPLAPCRSVEHSR
jgi:hypothetical protein